MARTLLVNESEWVFLLAWVQVSEYLKILPEINPILAEDIVWKHWIYDDPEYIPNYCIQYRFMHRTITMTSEGRIPSIKVSAQLDGIKVVYASSDKFDHSRWVVKSIQIQSGEREPRNFHYNDAYQLDPPSSWYPIKQELWDDQNNRYCFR